MRKTVLIGTVLTLFLAGLGLALGLSPALKGPQGSPQLDPAVRQLGNATVGLHRAMDAAAAGDLETAKALMADWEDVQDRVAETSPEYYQVSGRSWLAASIESLDEGIDLYLTQVVARPDGRVRTPAARLESLLDIIATAERDLSQGNLTAALAKVREAQAVWPFVEAQVKARSPEVYRLVEGELIAAIAALTQPVPDAHRAIEVLEKVENGLRPLTEREVEYGVFDPAIDWLGIFPTWETLLAQVALLLAAAVVLVLERRPQLRRV